MTRLAGAATLAAAAALAFHALASIEAATIIARDLTAPPLQLAVVLALSALLLRVSDVAPRAWRIRAAVAALVVFGIAMTALPLDHQFAGNGFMGDGYDYSQTATSSSATSRQRARTRSCISRDTLAT